MRYQMLPSFIFGFLLTTFPKWTKQPEIRRGQGGKPDERNAAGSLQVREMLRLSRRARQGSIPLISTT